MSLIADVSAAEAAVRDLIDLDVATHDPSVSPQLRRRLTAMRQRREQEVPGVRVSVAARMLGLSERTTRDWLARGPLDPVPGAKPARVSTASLATVLPAVEKLRELGQDRELLRALIDRLDAERILSLPRGQAVLGAAPTRRLRALLERGSLTRAGCVLPRQGRQGARQRLRGRARA